jgi:bifunctional non-homologous end joining protein LigD
MAQRPLEDYRRKRDFSRTAEPAPGRIAKRRHRNGGAFVIQKHAARQLHYDFRLEIGGVLASWAVPKGPSLDPADKRLAVRTEDHPMEYGGFEGTSPEGEYGGGTVMVWDRGRYVAEDDPADGLRKGKLSFRLEGKRVKGGYTLVQMHGPRSEAGKNWLLIKERDSEADGEDLTARATTSVKSGRSMDEIATRSRASWHSNRSTGQEKKAPRPKHAGAKRHAKAVLPDFIAPELATLVEAVPTGEGWLHEIKYDGYRIVAAVAGEQVRLYTRSGKDWTQRFHALVEPLRELRLPGALLDGEVAVADAKGRTDFGALQRAMEEGNTNLSYYVFDLLQVGGEHVRELPLLERKKLLRKVLEGAGRRGAIRFSEYTQGNGQQVFARACRARFEGIICKRADSTYRAGERTRDWLKVKCVAEQEFVIGGWSESERREGFASLLLGTMQNGKLVYAGRVGTGYDEQDLTRIGKRLRALEVDKPAFVTVPAAMRRKAHWVKPELVAQVRYTELTRDGIVRHGVFDGLREDKPAREVRMERAVEKPSPATGRAGRGDAAETVAGVRLTHADKVLYPKMGITKRDLAEYFAAAATRMLPHVKDRPVSLVRCPDGRRKACFFQRHATDGMPAAIGTVPIRKKEGKADYLTIRDAAGLVSCAQIGALELHIWGVHADDVERPDRLVFDLDPAEDVGFAIVRDAAVQLKDVLASAGLTAFAMVTGGKGVHLVIPIQRRHEWADVSGFTKAFAERIVALDPEHFVATMTKARRKGKIFIDHFRNTRSASAIAPWSTRAKDGAPVAMPVTWAEFKRLERTDAFSLADALHRVKGKDPWEDYFNTRQSLTAKTAAALGLKLKP